MATKGSAAAAKGEVAPKNLVVSRKADGKWVVKKEGARCASTTVATRAEAEAWARDAAEKEGVQVVIQQ